MLGLGYHLLRKQRRTARFAEATLPSRLLMYLLWFCPSLTLIPATTLNGIFLQCIRLWVLTTLGHRWTTRIIIVPGEPLIASGPYRYLPHPNYAVVVAEIAVLPLALHLPVVAAIFTLLNAAVLVIRVRAEARALAAGVALSRAQP